MSGRWGESADKWGFQGRADLPFLVMSSPFFSVKFIGAAASDWHEPLIQDATQN